MASPDIVQILSRIGLSEGEQKVYLALLELGEATSGPIAERSSVSASKVYQVIERLAKKGLVGEVEAGGVKRFKATHPRAILDLLKSREDEVKALQQSASAALPALIAKYQEHAQESEVQLFRGVKSVRNTFYGMLDDLKKGESYRVIGANYGGLAWTRAFFGHFHEERARRGVSGKLLFQRTFDIPEITRKGTELRYLPWSFATPMQINIWKENVAFVLLQEEPLVFTIKSASVAASFNEYFETLWRQEIETFTGKEGIKAILLEALKEKEIYFIGGGAYIPDRMTEWFDHEYVPMAIAAGHKWKNLVLPRIRGHRVHKLPFVESRFLPPGDYPPSVIYIWGDNVANVVWEEEPVAFVLRNAKVAASYRQYFEGLWNQEAQTWRGSDAIPRVVDDVLAQKSDLYLIGSHGFITKRYPAEYERMNKGLLSFHAKRHILARESTRGLFFNEGSNTDTVYIPDTQLSPLVIWVYGDVVSQVLWEDEVQVFRIQNKRVADDYRTYFHFLSRTAPERGKSLKTPPRSVRG